MHLVVTDCLFDQPQGYCPKRYITLIPFDSICIYTLFTYLFPEQCSYVDINVVDVFVGVGNVCDHGNGFFPDPNNCAEFIHCDNGKAVKTECPPTHKNRPLTFNPATNRCDYVVNVPCAKSNN